MSCEPTRGGKVDYASSQFWLGVAQWIFNVLVTVYLLYTRKHQAAAKRFEDAVKRIDGCEKNIIAVKAKFSNLPTRKQFSDLNKEMRSLTKELSETKGRLHGINRAVDLINEHLINKGG